jgi:glycosyltransferase involved in cell wall biosynthesis
MPAFNAEATIQQAVVTTLRAMPRDSELVVLDDKSTDKTLAVLDGIPDRRLRIIANQENLGSGSARQRLLVETDSEFVAAMDADDITFPWRFALQLRALESFDVVFGSVVRFDRAHPGGLHRSARLTMQIRPSAPIALRPDEFPAALLFHCGVWQSSLTAKRSAFGKVGGYQPLRYGQDWDLFLRMAASGASMYRSAVPLIAYRASPFQVTRRSDYLRIFRSTALRNSYTELFNSRVKLGINDSKSASTSALEVTIKAGLAEQLRVFRAVNRLRYSRLLRSNQNLSAIRLFDSTT